LTLPQVKTPVQEPCEPVDWFQVIAPILESPAAPKRQDRRAPAAPGSARTVTFGDVDDFARQELQRKRDVLAQPKEVVEMIAVTARDSQRIVDEAREEAKRILKEARDEGYSAGMRAGYADGERQATELLTARADADRAAYRADLQDLVHRIETARARFWEELELQVITLVLDTAKHVIKQEVTATSDAAISVIRDALRRVSDAGALRIRVNVDDLPAVRSSRQQILDVLDGVRRVEIVEDRTVGPGGCIIDTDAGAIDARIETQLAETEDIVLSSLPLRKAA
jgi:flagellar assembly protein FliH